MTGTNILVAVGAGYLGYHLLHTPQGRDAAKSAIKFALAQSGAAENALKRILKLKPTSEEEKP